MTAVLGLSAFYHDSAAALVIDGGIAAAAQEERFTRKKHTPDFPVNAVRYCLDDTGLCLDDLDAVVFYDKPLLKFERLLETYYATAPRGLSSFLASIPVWIREKLFLKKLLWDGLAQVEPYDRKRLNLLFSEHHLSHAASAFYPSPFDEAAILTIDGVGEWATASISTGSGSGISLLKEMRFPHSVGLLYSAFTYFLGFRVNSGEYKLMGLAPYGNKDADQTRRFIDIIKTRLVSIKEDGSIWLDMSYFNYMTGLTMVNEKKWENLFGFPIVQPDGELSQHHCNLAYAIQAVTEEIVLKMAAEARRLTGLDRLCLAGGVSLNCVANSRLLQSGLFREIFIQPASGDAGGALGAAQIVSHRVLGSERRVNPDRDAMKGAFLGPYFSDKEAVQTFNRYRAVYERTPDTDTLCSQVADRIAQGMVVGWFQGRMEYGPRALGNRSILGDARNPDMQKKMNLKIKYRESFRPFAPSVLAEASTDFFDLPVASPYMLLTAPVKKNRRTPLPEGYHDLPLTEKLYWQRSDIQAVTHLDFSARVQTVHSETNPKYWKLIDTFRRKTGYGILVNTSFNVRGEPIVCTPDDAYRCFMRTEMDVLVINDYLLDKPDQPDWQNRQRWAESFDPD